MLANNLKLYSQIFNQHGPLVFAFGYIISKFGDFGISVYRLPIFILNWVAIYCTYTSPVLKENNKIYYTVISWSLIYTAIPSFWGFVYQYQVIAGMLSVIILVRYVMPHITGISQIEGLNSIIFGFLLSLFPFLAVTYLPFTILVLIISLSINNYKKLFIGIFTGVIFNILFLLKIGSIKGYYVDHFYFNSKILPLYNGGQSISQLLAAIINFHKYNIFGNLILMSIIFYFIYLYRFLKLSQFIKVVSLALVMELFLMRGFTLHGIPFYYSLIGFFSLFLCYNRPNSRVSYFLPYIQFIINIGSYMRSIHLPFFTE